MKVSVIIPVYNIENYIEKCVNSIFNQTHQNLEIICVNDGSKDNSAAKLDEIAKIDNRIVIINKENGGLSDARNAGLDVATGDLLYFIDGDDFIDPNYIEGMVKAIEENNADVAINLNFEWYYGENHKDNHIKQSIIDNHDFKMNVVNPSSCNKIFKKSFLDKHNLRFAFGLKYEDYEFWNRLYIHIDQLPISNKGVYHYLQREASIMGQSNQQSNIAYNDDFLRCVESIYNYQKEHNKFSPVNFGEVKNHLFRQNKKYVKQYMNDARALFKSFDKEFVKLQSKRSLKAIKSFTSVLGRINLLFRAYKK